MNDNPAWLTSRYIWMRASGMSITFHHFRRRMQSLVEKGLVERRVKHENYTHAATGNVFSTPVYEYRRKVNIDDLTD